MLSVLATPALLSSERHTQLGGTPHHVTAAYLRWCYQVLLALIGELLAQRGSSAHATPLSRVTSKAVKPSC